jgi:hypothetical protein
MKEIVEAEISLLESCKKISLNPSITELCKKCLAGTIPCPNCTNCREIVSLPKEDHMFIIVSHTKASALPGF